MKAICKRGTKRLIKGHTYEVESIWNDGTNGWREGNLELKEIDGSYSVNTFTDINGKSLPNINVISDNHTKRYNRLEFKEIKEGDILVCTSKNYKTLIENGMYVIERLESTDFLFKGFNGANYTHTTNKIKFKGIKRTFNFSSWNFRKLTTEECRKHSLEKILDDSMSGVITSTVERNIDLVNDKEDRLLKILASSIVDKYRHGLSIIDWACEKKGDKLSVKKEDYEPYLNMTLKEILEKIK